MCCATPQELSDQQLKQMLLAYMMLIMKGRAMLQQDLDDACEVRTHDSCLLCTGLTCWGTIGLWLRATRGLIGVPMQQLLLLLL